jgi:hypothetical protein
VRIGTRSIVILAAVSVAVAFAGVALSQRGSLGADPEAALRMAPNSVETTHASPKVDGQRWGLRSYENAARDICLSHDVPGEAIGTSCFSRKQAFADGPLFALHGARQISANYPKTDWDNMWVYGIADSRIKDLKLVNMDCSTVSLQLDAEGMFHHVVGVAQIRQGVIPYKLVAIDPNGEVVAEREVAVGLTSNAKRAGLEAPRPAGACS